MIKEATRFQLSAIGLAGVALLAGCGGGGGGSGGSGGAVQTIAFDFPGGVIVAVPPAVATTELKATASSGGPITFTSNTPAVCTVSGSTLSVVTAGECSVTATQPGYQGYATASQSQLFVIPKQPQTIVFRNPGSQALDTQPVALAATASTGRPVVFTTSTPSVCSVSGTSLSKLADGLCVVTATQDGSDIYVAATLPRTIPVGSATAPAVTFLSGYKDSSTTKEGGGIGGTSGINVNGWWCNGHCTNTVPADGGSFNFATDFTLDHPRNSDWIGGSYNMWAYAPKVTELTPTANTANGLRIDAQAALKFTLAQNADWVAAGQNAVNVDLVLGHYALKDAKACNVTLRAKVTPSATPTAYSLGLKDRFTFGETCGLTGLDLWTELQDYPIAKINFSQADSVNTQVSSTGPDKPTYKSALTLSGAISFQ